MTDTIIKTCPILEKKNHIITNSTKLCTIIYSNNTNLCKDKHYYHKTKNKKKNKKKKNKKHNKNQKKKSYKKK